MLNSSVNAVNLLAATFTALDCIPTFFQYLHLEKLFIGIATQACRKLSIIK